LRNSALPSRRLFAFALAIGLLLPLAAFGKPPKSADIYFIDMEGGQATLVIAPSGQSMLIDTCGPQKLRRAPICLKSRHLPCELFSKENAYSITVSRADSPFVRLNGLTPENETGIECNTSSQERGCEWARSVSIRKRSAGWRWNE
jgi:hypothetical protein